MKKLTTADCKKFLVKEITKNPNIIHDIYEDKITAIKEALVEKNWIRESKFNPNVVDKENYYTKNNLQIKSEDLVTIRKFCLLPRVFDTAVAFYVLEDKNGNLILGEYVGD